MKKFENSELQKRYDTETDFRNKVIMSQQEYYLLRKKASEMKPEQIINDSFLEKFVNKDKLAIYFMYGHMQPHPGKATGNLTLNFLLNFKPEPDQVFAFVYFNHLTPSSDYFKQFKNIFLLLPLTILQKMVAFVLVKPTFYLKAMNYITITISGSYFNKCYFTVDNCQQLCDKLKISVQDFVRFVPEEYSEEFPEKYKRDVSLRNYRVNLLGQNLSQSQKLQQSQFEETINALISKEVYRIENYEIGELGVPVILEMLVIYFKGQPEGLKLEGIFRKSVAVDQEQQTYLELSKRNYEYLETISNPHLIASLIKKFFNNLKQPIIPFPLFMEMMNDNNIANKKQHLKKLVAALPKLNFTTLAFLIDFLKKDVITQQKENKMSANNIAICFSPCLMRSEKASMADLAFATKSVFYTGLLITQFDYLFGSEQQRNLLFKSNILEHNKIFQQTVLEELQFDQEDQRPPAVQIRPTMSYTMEEDGSMDEIVRREDIFPQVQKIEVKPQSKVRKLSDKIQQVSNEIKDIERRFTERKKSGSTIQVEGYRNSPLNINLEETTVMIQLQPEEQQMMSIHETSAKRSRFHSADTNDKQDQSKKGKVLISQEIKHHETISVTKQYLRQEQRKGGIN